MKKIYKYTFQIQDQFIINMQTDAQILTVQIQYGMPCIWAIVDENNQEQHKRFRLFGTGQLIDEEELKLLKYIGTFQLANGGLVFHLFEYV